MTSQLRAFVDALELGVSDALRRSDILSTADIRKELALALVEALMNAFDSHAVARDNQTRHSLG